MTYRAALFDLDGTLIASKQLYLEAYRAALAVPFGRRLTDDEIIGLRPQAELRFLPGCAEAHNADVCLQRFYEVYQARHTELFEGVYPGVLPLLAHLRQRAVPLGLVTGKSRRGWQITEPHCGLGPFDVVIADDDVHSPKPDPAGLHRALERLGAAPGQAIYVGDSRIDLEAAAAAGVTPVAVLWSKGSHRSEFLRLAQQLGARIAQQPGDLLKFF